MMHILAIAEGSTPLRAPSAEPAHLPLLRGEVSIRGAAGAVPDHHNKANIAIKRVVIFLLAENLAFPL